MRIVKLQPLDILIAVLSVTFWGLCFPLMKIAAQEVTPLLSVGIRLFFMSLLSLPFLNFPKGRKEWGKLTLIGITLFVLPFGLTSIAVLYVDASIAALITELEVVFGVILTRIFLHEPIRPLQIFGMLLAFFGVYLIIYSPEVHIDNLWAILLLVIVAFSYAAAALQVREVNQSLSSFSVTGWSCILSVPWLFLSSYWLERDQWIPLGMVSTQAWVCIGVMAVVSLLGLYIWNDLLKRFSVNAVLPFGMLIPLSALVFSYFLLGETTNLLAMVGGLLTIVGVKIQLHR